MDMRLFLLSAFNGQNRTAPIKEPRKLGRYWIIQRDKTELYLYSIKVISSGLFLHSAHKPRWIISVFLPTPSMTFSN